MHARCESLIAIRSRDSRSVMRRHRDVQLRGMGSYVRSGCSPPTLGESGAITPTRLPQHFVLLDYCVLSPRPRHKERVSAQHELAIFRCLSPATPSCIQSPRLFSFILLPFGDSCLVGFLFSFFARTTSVQGPSTRRDVWFALSCSDEASRPESRIPERPLFVLHAARPLQLKFQDTGFVYVPMVWRGQTRQPSTDRRPIYLVEVLVCYFLLWSYGNRRRFPQALWPVVPVRGPVYGRMHFPVVGETGTLLLLLARAILHVIDKSSQASRGAGPRLGGG